MKKNAAAASTTTPATIIGALLEAAGDAGGAGGEGTGAAASGAFGAVIAGGFDGANMRRSFKESVEGVFSAPSPASPFGGASPGATAT